MAGNLKAILAEFIGTFAVVLIGAGAVCADAMSGGKLGWCGVAAAQGLALAVMFYAYGHVSGGHFNPAITIGMRIHGRIDAVKSVFYVTAQLMGAALAAVCLKAVYHDQSALLAPASSLGACSLSGVGYRAATLLEAVATFFLVTAYEAGSDSRCPSAVAPLAVGAALCAGTLMIGPLTGAALNPARAFGPAIATGLWADWFVYWIGPLTGSIFSLWLHENVYIEKKNPA